MTVELLRFLALTIGPSVTAAARPAVTFFAIQLVVTGLVYGDVAALPESFAWLVSVPALIVAGVLAGLETAASHDPDVAALLRDLKVDNITGAFGAFSVALLFASLGLPEEDVMGMTGAMEGATTGSTGAAALGGGGLLEATSTAVTADKSTPLQVGAIGGALGINIGLTWLRGELLEFVDDFELGKLWARIETGGVVGVLILLPLLPLVMLAFLTVFAIGLVAVSLGARAASDYVDSQSRTNCASCGHRLREEASICPECRTERTPTVESESGLSAAWTALRRRPLAEVEAG